jgi:hypothetical protein
LEGELLLDLKRRGLTMAPQLAVADGALGFWKAIDEVWPKTRAQRCWVHKTANVLNKLPKSLQAKAKRALQDIWMAETRTDAEAAFDGFIESYGVKYEKAVECLSKDCEPLLAFYDFPAEHWKHLRTTNPIESTFATVRLVTAGVRLRGNVRARPQLRCGFLKLRAGLEVLMMENKSVQGKMRRDRYNNDPTKDSEHIVQGENVNRDYHRYPTERHVCQLHYDVAEKVGGEYPA